MNRLSFIVIAGFVGLATSAPGSSPWRSWVFCKEVNPDENNQCIMKSVASALSNDLFKGSSYFGTPSLDPMDIPELSVFDANGNKPVSVNITFKDGKIFGLSNFDVEEMKTDWKNGKVSGIVALKVPIKFISDYSIGGKVILLPITGAGKSQLTFEGLTVAMTADLKVIEKKNKKYFRADKFHTELRPKQMKVQLENLFNGNKALGDNMNTILNENWKELMKDLGEPLSQGLSESFKQIASRVFAKIPIDNLTPK